MVNISMPFIKDFKFNDKIKEFDIKFKTDDNYLDLLKFVETYGDKRINIELSLGIPDIDFSDLERLVRANPNVHFKLSPAYFEPELTSRFRNLNLPFYFRYYVCTWDELNSLLEAGVSDVYISGELGFSLPKIRLLTDRYLTNIRVFVNGVQVLDPTHFLDSLVAFYIRPEDIDLYSQYVDSFELVYDNLAELKTYYQIYAIDKRWFGPLQEIIVGLDQSVNNERLLPLFGRSRLSCGKKCSRLSNCDICHNLVKLAETLKDKDLIPMESE